MHLLTTLLSLLTLTLAQAPFDDWHPAAPTDLRSPCPGLNALANHGLIPRNGKNLTVPTVVKGLSALNMTTEIATLLSLAALKTSSDPASGAFTLKDLARHNFIEHDGSLSRQDTDLPGGEKQDLNRDVYEEFLSSFDGATEISVALAAAARWARIQASKNANPKHTYNPTSRFNSYAESGVYFQALMDPAKGTVPLTFLKVLFEEERFPAKEGWRPVNTLHGFSMAGVILQLALNTPEEACEVSGVSESFHAAFL